MIKAYSPIAFDYIEEIFLSINRNLVTASEKDNPEAFKELLDFVLYTLISKSFNSSLSSYSRAVTSLITTYPRLQPKYKEIFIERVSESLVTKIYFANKLDTSDEYISLTFQSIIHIIKRILEEDNPDLFNVFFKSSQNSLFKLDIRNNKNDYLFKFVTILICWFYFLKFTNKIADSKYNTTLIENIFLQISTDNNNHFVDRFYKLYNEIDQGFWYIHNWEISEPPVNVVYTALMPSHWLPFSLVLILLKNIHLVNIGNIDNIELNSKFKFQLDDVTKILDTITIDSVSHLEFIFPKRINEENLQDQLNYRKEKIKELFSTLKRKAEIEHYEKIRAIPLSDIRIEEFRKEIGENLQNNTVVINLLKKFDKVNYKKNIEEKNAYGFFHTLQKGKFAFIDDENYQQIYGLSNFGNELARSLDNLFFSEILDNVEPFELENLNEFLNKYFSRKKKLNYTVIFGDWRLNNILKNVKYESGDAGISSATYNQIPVVNSYNNYDNLIFIVDFENVEADIYTSESTKWYKKEVLVDVTEYQKEEITANRIKEWKEKDKLDYSEEDVDILESNNVNIKVLYKCDYKFKNFKNVKVLSIK